MGGKRFETDEIRKRDHHPDQRGRRHLQRLHFQLRAQKAFGRLCEEVSDKKVGYQSYLIDKARLSIRITAPYSEERRKAASERAKEYGSFRST